MTLLTNLAAYLTGLGITGPFPLGEILDGDQSTATLLQVVGTHDSDPTRTHLHPTVQIFFRRTTQAAAHANAWTAYRALNAGRVTLASGYHVRALCPAEPIPLGRDGRNLWRYTLDVNFSLPYSAAI